MRKFILSVLSFSFGMLTLNADAITTTELVNNVVDDSNAAISTIYSDSKEVISTVYQDGKDAVQYLYPELKQAISGLAENIGVGAEHVYSVLVRQQVVNGISSLLIVITCLIVLIFSIKSVQRLISEGLDCRIIIPSVLSLISLVALFRTDLTEMLTGLINPNFGAINYIVEYAKDVIK